MKYKILSFTITLIVLLAVAIPTQLAPVQAATQAQIDDAIQDGLAWLATQQNSTYGYFGSSYRLANTATAVLAFENEGHFPGGGTTYSTAVEKGLNYIFTRAYKIGISVQTYGYTGRNDNPDTNGNGQGIYFNDGNYMYETGIVMQAIVASNTPDRVVSGGNCAGMTYRKVMEDLVDFISWAQIDGGSGRGGWRYGYYNNASGYGDNSVSQWPVLGLVAAAQWGINAPLFVKNEMQYWVTFIQNPITGGSGYDIVGTYENVSKTGGLLVEFFYLGDAVSAPRVVKAINYINSKWNETPWGTWYGNKGNPYAMFAVFKGLELYKVTTMPAAPANPDTLAGDWWGDYCHYLVGTQTHLSSTLGYWGGYAYWGQHLATPWYIIILQASVFPVSVDIVVPSVACDDTGYDVSVHYSVARFEADGALTVKKDGGIFDIVTLDNFKGSATVNYNILNDDVGAHSWEAVLSVTGGGISVTTEDTETGQVYETPQVSGIPDQYAPFSTFDLDDYQTCSCTNVDWSVTGVPTGWTVTIDTNHVVTVVAPESATAPVEITFTAIFHWPGINCTDSDTAIFSPNRPPVADAGKDYGQLEFYEVLEGGTVDLDGSRSYDPDGDALISYDWDLNEDGTFETPGMIVTFSAAGLDKPPTNRLYVFLKVVDEHGASDVAQARINILDRAPEAAFNWSPKPQDENSTIQFADKSTSVVDTIVAWNWDFGGLGTSNKQNPSFTFADNGVYTVTLTVTDDDGSVATVSHKVTVANVAPVVNAGEDAENYSGDTHEVKATFTDVGVLDTHTATIDWGDGTVEAGAVSEADGSGTVTGSHVYFELGEYTITITVKDDDGGIASDSLTKTVARLPVDIDIKPGSWPNSLNLNGNGSVPVGVFGSADFDVAKINLSTVKFGVTGFEAVPVHNGGCGHIEDLNGDGINDMGFHFVEGQLGISTATPANTEMPLYLTAQLTNGVYFEGKDIVRITPNNENSQGKGGKGPK